MTRLFSVLLAAVLALFIVTIPAQAQQYPPEGVIVTNGHGETRVKPDSLSINAQVETTNESLETARDLNNRTMERIIRAVKGLDIPNLVVETRHINVYPIQSREPERKKTELPETIGYRVSNSLSITVTGVDTDELGTYGSNITDTALDAGANRVNGLNFFVADDALRAIQRETLQKAVKDARKNAEAMASAAGVTITGVHSVEGAAQTPRPMYRSYDMAMSARAESAPSPTPVETGEQTVTSDVTVRFAF